jgi:hypothetical protein
MTIKKYVIIVIFVLKLTTAHGVSDCRAIFDTSINNSHEEVTKKSPRLLDQNTTPVKIMNHNIVNVHNSEIARELSLMTNRPDQKMLLNLVKMLQEHDTFDIPMTPEGYVPAANNGVHHGGYGSYVWLRDLARIFSGISAKMKLTKSNAKTKAKLAKAKSNLSQLAKALLKLFSEDLQIERTLKNIINPDLHNDPHNGFRNVIFVRLGLTPRTHGQQLTEHDVETESKWGHKQNDALALYGQTLLDGLARGEIKYEDMNIDMKAELIYLVSYFERIHFASMEDVGAWEEKMGVRTSSIGLVLSFLERFQDGWSGQPHISKNEKFFFAQLRKDWEQGIIQKHFESFLSNHSSEFSISTNAAWQILTQSLYKINDSLSEAYSVLYSRLGIKINNNGTHTYQGLVEVDGPNEKRGADAAILHILLYPPKRLTIEDRLHTLNELKLKLMRDSGFVRYNQDWFLYGGPSAIASAAQLPLNPDMIAVTDHGQYRSSSREDRDRIYEHYQIQKYNKDMSQVIDENGDGLEAQWTFQDSMLSQIFVQLFKETKESKYLDLAWLHLARALALITGEKQITVEGQSVEPFRVPEAWIPVRLIQNNTVHITFFASPNSPLNWATAEMLKALNSYYKVVN